MKLIVEGGDGDGIRVFIKFRFFSSLLFPSVKLAELIFLSKLKGIPFFLVIVSTYCVFIPIVFSVFRFA